MAAGVFNGRFTLGAAAATLDSLTGGAQTYSHISLRRMDGAVCIGNSGVTLTNGFPLLQGETTHLQGGILGANLNLIGPGEVQFFGNATA